MSATPHTNLSHRTIARAFQADTVDLQPATRTITARVNVASVDRYRTVIDPGSLQTAAFMRNPVVLWEHGEDPARGTLPVGRCLDIRRTRRETIARTQFHDDEFSLALWRLYEAEICRGWSIHAGADWDRTGRPDASELRDHPDWKGAELVYRNADLYEFSAVAVPGNADALTIAVTRGLALPDSVRRSLERAMKTKEDDDDHPDHPDHTVIKDGDKHFVKLARSGRCMPERGCSERSEATALCRALNDHHGHMAEEYGSDGGEPKEGRSSPHATGTAALPSLKGCRSLAQVEAKLNAATGAAVGSLRRQIITDAEHLARGGI